MRIELLSVENRPMDPCFYANARIKVVRLIYKAACCVGSQGLGQIETVIYGADAEGAKYESRSRVGVIVGAFLGGRAEKRRVRFRLVRC